MSLGKAPRRPMRRRGFTDLVDQLLVERVDRTHFARHKAREILEPKQGIGQPFGRYVIEHPTVIGRLARFVGDARTGQQLPGDFVPARIIHCDDKNRPEPAFHLGLSTMVTHLRRQKVENVFVRKGHT